MKRKNVKWEWSPPDDRVPYLTVDEYLATYHEALAIPNQRFVREAILYVASDGCMPGRYAMVLFSEHSGLMVNDGDDSYIHNTKYNSENFDEGVSFLKSAAPFKLHEIVNLFSEEGWRWW